MTNDAPAPGVRAPEGPHDAEPLFPSEGSFNPVVPLSEVGHAPAPLPTVRPEDVGKPAEAAWARAAHRARSREEEETLVPSRASRTRGARPSWLLPASVIALSVIAGLASGSYLIWSSQRAQEPPPPQVAAEAPPPAPVTNADAEVEKAPEPVKVEKPREVARAEKPSAKAAEKPEAVAPAPKQSPTPRAERPARAAAEPKELKPAPRPARTQNAAPARPRLTTAETRTPAPPVSSPPPSAKSKKVIQWP